MAALALAQERAALSFFERFAFRAVGLACLLALASVAVNYAEVTASPSTDDELAVDDPVAMLLDA